MRFYAFAGKKNVGFGDFSTLSPFTQAMPWHYFAPIAEGGGVGFDNQLLRATVTALNGSRGNRVSDSSQQGRINNFAANLLVRARPDESTELDLGGGYLYGTIYNADTAEHLNSALFGPNNGAWDLNSRLRLGRLTLAGEYVQTVEPWPVVNHVVSAWRGEGAWDFVLADRLARFSVSWSEGRQGPDGSEFETNRQLVVGLRYDPIRNAFLTVEYVRSLGFAPLINISTVSDRDVIQDSIVFGGVFSM